AGAGLPAVYDSALAPSLPPPAAELAPWAILAPEGGWLIAAIAIVAAEPLTAFHQRVAAALRSQEEAQAPGLLLPGPWDARRRQARERGVPLDPHALDALRRWAARLNVPMPEPRKEGLARASESR
ncbi:MAG: hypothetical protein IRY99_16620, partial [Isosphaeraceae bacterium]|nr:hypothetical protein [Isosphaeraceae bacterium]